MIPFIFLCAFLSRFVPAKPAPWNPDDCDEQMSTLGWLVVLFAVVLPLALIGLS